MISQAPAAFRSRPFSRPCWSQPGRAAAWIPEVRLRKAVLILSGSLSLVPGRFSVEPLIEQLRLAGQRGTSAMVQTDHGNASSRR